jgi:pimeloyl-ACP methyl ester carboxylesterase
VNLRRAYFDCRFGQLHVRTAFPNTGGFDERTALVLLHPSPLSSRAFAPLLAELGTDRSLYAVDLPGYGESDAPPREPSIGDYAAAIGDLLDGLRLREVDLLGWQAGSAVAVELAVARPTQVRRLALAGLPLFTAPERATFDRQAGPAVPAEDGSHLVGEWRRALAAGERGAPLAIAADAFADRLRAGPRAHWALRAAVHWRGDERLGLVRQPTLVLRARDEWWDQTERGRALLPAARWHDLPDRGPALFTTGPAAAARELRAFFDA